MRTIHITDEGDRQRVEIQGFELIAPKGATLFDMSVFADAVLAIASATARRRAIGADEDLTGLTLDEIFARLQERLGQSGPSDRPNADPPPDEGT